MNTALVFALGIVALTVITAMFIRKRTTVWPHWLALIEDRAEACEIFVSMSFHGSPVDPYVSYSS